MMLVVAVDKIDSRSEVFSRISNWGITIRGLLHLTTGYAAGFRADEQWCIEPVWNKSITCRSSTYVS